MALEDQQNFLLFDNQDNFALLDTPEGAIHNNGLYEQLAYVFDNLPTGWNQFHPIFGENHNDWAAGGEGSDTLVGDSEGDLSCEANNVKPVDAETTQSNDVLYGGSGWYLDYDNETNPYIQGRVLPEDDGANSTQPPSFDDKVIGIDMDDFDLSFIGREFGISPRFDYAGDELIGGRGNDTIFGQFGNDTIDGGGGSDYLFGGRNNDLMDGDYLGEDNGVEVNQAWRQDGTECDDGDRGDVMFGERGKDTMFGGDDSVSRQWSYTINDMFRRDDGELCYANFRVWNYDGDWMSGGRGSDVMAGEEGFDTMYGDRCKDTMSGGYHYDLMYGGKGSDIMYGGTDASDSGGDDLDDDVQTYDTDYQSTANCEYRCAYEGNWDQTGYYLRPEGADGYAGYHSEYRGGDTMYGGYGHDQMYGGAGDDLMYGGKGRDTMYGGNDDDRMLGEGGDDDMYGGNGWDDMSGGSGDDYMSGGNGNDYMEGNSGNDTMYGDAHADIMHGNDGMDLMYGGTGDDVMYGEADMDVMYGNEGNDCMHGGGDRDYMEGNAGNDKMDGGEANDTLIGGEGDDTIWISGGTSTKYEIVVGDDHGPNYSAGQGGGNDTFVYNFSYDETTHTATGDSGYVFIADFNANEDVLQLCFDDPVTFCCDQDDEYYIDPQNWDFNNDNMIRALSEPHGSTGQHGVTVVDNGEYTLIIFDDTQPDGQDASDPEHHNDEVIWLQGVSGSNTGNAPFATLEDLDAAGYRIEIHHPDHLDWAKTLSGNQYGEGDWTYASCEIDCGCDISPFDMQTPEEMVELT